MDRPLDADLADEVLERLGVDAPAADLQGLRAVYRAWCDHVPFDNLQKLVALREGRRPLPGDDAGELFRNWLRDGTGGTCWASSNGLFHLLRHVGFDVTRLTAAMMDLPDPNHATNLVDLGDARYLVDTSVLSGDPLEVTDGRTGLDPTGYAVDLNADGDTWVMTFPSAAHARMVCRVFPDPSDADAYGRLHERTRELSVFNDLIHVTRHRDGSVWNLRHRTLTRLHASEQDQRELSDDEARSWLVDSGFSGRIVDAALASER